MRSCGFVNRLWLCVSRYLILKADVTPSRVASANCWQVSFPLRKVSAMKKFVFTSAVLSVLGVSMTLAVMAQPPGDRPPGDRPPGDRPPGGDRQGAPRDGGRGEPGRPPMPNPLVAALDKNGDHEISAEELQEATASLLTLDKNKDGKLTDDEMRPPHPEGRGPEGRGPDGRGPDGRGPEGRGPDGRGPDGRGPDGRGPEGRGPDGRGPDGRGPDGRGPDGRGPDGRGPDGRGPMGPPSPEKFVEEAMRFDADGDQKLSHDELMKFAEEMGRRRGGRPPEGGPERGRPEGDRPDAARDEEDERPRRPEAE